MNEFRFRPLEVHLVEQQGDDKTITALTPPVCDFCADVRVRWDYDCDDFVIDDIPVLDGVWGSQGGFAACDKCSHYIEHEEWRALIARVVRSWRAKGMRTTKEHIRDATTFIANFRLHYKPGRKAFG